MTPERLQLFRVRAFCALSRRGGVVLREEDAWARLGGGGTLRSNLEEMLREAPPLPEPVQCPEPLGIPAGVSGGQEPEAPPLPHTNLSDLWPVKREPAVRPAGEARPVPDSFSPPCTAAPVPELPLPTVRPPLDPELWQPSSAEWAEPLAVIVVWLAFVCGGFAYNGFPLPDWGWLFLLLAAVVAEVGIRRGQIGL